MTQTESTAVEQVEKPQPPKNIIEYIKLDSIQQSAEKALGSGGRQFLTSIISFANSNAAIMECEPRSVYTACLTAATLDLSVNPNLGQAYILPYKNKGVMQAQFQIGYRGFIQLAERSGQFKRIGVREVRDEQLIGFDHFGEPLFDFNVGAEGEVIGYMAYFELINGFYKIDFMTVAELEKHGKLYSQTYKKGFGVWKDNFGAMAKKTVIKLLLSKWAPLNTEMQKAIEEDQKVEEVYADNKIVFEVEGAAINDEPIEVIDVEVPADDYIVDEPVLKMSDAQRRKAFAIFGKLPEDLKAKAEEGRKTLFGDKSRNDYTRDEANTWIDYLTGLQEGKETSNG